MFLLYSCNREQAYTNARTVVHKEIATPTPKNHSNTNTGGYDDVLEWEHDCAARRTRFTIIGASKGWLGVGFIATDAFSTSQHMNQVRHSVCL